MKKLFMLSVLLASSLSFAAPPKYENPIGSCSDTLPVALSTTYAEITTQDLAGRTGVFVVNLATNTIVVHLDMGSSAPTDTRFAELQPGEWDVFPVPTALNLYAKSASGTPSVHVKECTNR